MDILIVGTGIAGPTLAYWLRRAGHRPTLVERAPQLRTGGYLIDFWGAGFEVAERMGIVPELLRRGYRAREVRQVDRDGTRITSMNPEVFVGSQSRYVSLARSDLAAVVYDTLAGEVETIFDETVRAIEDDGRRVHVAFERTAARDFDLVVGADGLHSGVRRLVFGPHGDFERYLGFKIAAFDLVGFRPREESVATLYTEVGHQITSFPMRDDATMIAITFIDEGPEVPATRAEQEALLRSRLAGAGWHAPAILEQMSAAQGLYMDRVSQICMPGWSRGRVVLLGDAAACPSLLSGQGSALAMVEAYVLASQLARAPDHEAAFAGYEQLLAPLLHSKQQAAQRLALAFAPKNRFQLFVRNGVMKLMGVPWVARLAAGRAFNDAIRLPPPPDT